MRPGIVRLAKKVVIDKLTSEANLKQLWDSIHEMITERMNRMSNSQQSWKELHMRIRNEFAAQAASFGVSTLEQLSRRVPDNETYSKAEKELIMEGVKTEIVDFSGGVNTLILHFHFTTEPLLLIGVIGDRLLLAKNGQVQAFKDGEVVHDTFSIAFGQDYEIVEYRRLD